MFQFKLKFFVLMAVIALSSSNNSRESQLNLELGIGSAGTVPGIGGIIGALGERGGARAVNDISMAGGADGEIVDNITNEVGSYISKYSSVNNLDNTLGGANNDGSESTFKDGSYGQNLNGIYGQGVTRTTGTQYINGIRNGPSSGGSTDGAETNLRVVGATNYPNGNTISLAKNDGSETTRTDIAVADGSNGQNLNVIPGGGNTQSLTGETIKKTQYRIRNGNERSGGAYIDSGESTRRVVDTPGALGADRDLINGRISEGVTRTTDTQYKNGNENGPSDKVNTDGIETNSRDVGAFYRPNGDEDLYAIRGGNDVGNHITRHSSGNNPDNVSGNMIGRFIGGANNYDGQNLFGTPQGANTQISSGETITQYDNGNGNGQIGEANVDSTEFAGNDGRTDSLNSNGESIKQYNMIRNRNGSGPSNQNLYLNNQVNNDDAQANRSVIGITDTLNGKSHYIYENRGENNGAQSGQTSSREEIRTYKTYSTRGGHLKNNGNNGASLVHDGVRIVNNNAGGLQTSAINDSSSVYMINDGSARNEDPVNVVSRNSNQETQKNKGLNIFGIHLG